MEKLFNSVATAKPLDKPYISSEKRRMLTKIKKRFQHWISTGAKLAHQIGLTPNVVSALGMMFAVMSATAYANAYLRPSLLLVAPILLLVSGFCDALDGAIARIHVETTVFGKFLDSMLDRFADAVILGGIIFGGLCDPLWGFVALVGSLMVSYARARAEALGVEMEAVGVAERAERLVIVAAASFLSVFWPDALYWAVILLALLTSFTVLQRVAHFVRASKNKE
ncbi:MAG: CDP-alcohol phosphatidyltransferase family protein [Candidatus Bathyarchaeota archaeon]|nr:MAG: CDP-alcohol phosphatidyltransferase family protein [Candidatus Bathyarchaeota archaeon]